MNRPNQTYCQAISNATFSGTFAGFVFTDEEKASGFLDSKAQRNSLFADFVSIGKDPRKGWRIPLNEIKYNEQRDQETGYGYFGARYMDHELTTMWLSVDPMADKYPSISPYAYCAWNPVKLVDSDGSDTVNFANSRFLRSQPDYSNVLIINAHGKKFPPVVKNDNIDYDNDFSVISSNSINASSLASYIRKTNVYHDNDKNNRITPLFLISCQTGESTVPYYSFADGLGQACPNSLVVAPVGDVHAKNGFFQLSPKDGEKYHCYWRILYNGEDIGRIENYQAFDIKTLVSRTQEAVNSYNAKHPDNPIQMPEINQQ